MVQFDISSVIIDSTSYGVQRQEVSGNTQDLISEIDGVVIECFYKHHRETIYRVYVHYDNKWWVVVNIPAHNILGYMSSIHNISSLEGTIRADRMLLVDKIEILTTDRTVFTTVLPGLDSILLFIQQEELLERL